VFRPHVRLTSSRVSNYSSKGWIAKYNGTPFLIKRPGQTGFLFSHPELSCMEFDVSLHVFPYLAKQAICFMKESFFRKTLVTFGFVIEGRTDDEVSSFWVVHTANSEVRYSRVPPPAS
jgi:hypothetical protein